MKYMENTIDQVMDVRPSDIPSLVWTVSLALPLLSGMSTRRVLEPARALMVSKISSCGITLVKERFGTPSLDSVSIPQCVQYATGEDENGHSSR